MSLRLAARNARDVKKDKKGGSLKDAYHWLLKVEHLRTVSKTAPK
jgi:hypothetical protein